MASFDIINAAGQAYKTSWEARSYLLRLAAIPFFLKLFCFTIASSYAGADSGGNDLRFMLIMVPAFVTEGWMLSHYVRFIVFGQTWPFRPTGDIDIDMPILKTRARGILSGLIVFTLINMAVGFLMALMGQYMEPYMHLEEAGATTVKVPMSVAFISFAMLGFMLWGFRLIWLYIPYAINMGATHYLKGVRGIFTSIHMIGVWILCFVPFILALKLVAMIVITPLSMTLGQDVASFTFDVFTVVADTLKGIVATAGITYGLREIFSKKVQA